MSLTEFFIIALLIFGAVLHGVTGLGFPMISTMSVAILFPLPLAVALVVLPNVFINLMVLLPSKKSPNALGAWFCIKKYAPLIVASFIGCIIGVILLKKLSLSWLYLSLGLATLFYIFYTLFGQKKNKTKRQTPENTQNNTLKMLFFGALAGIIGGATNAMSSILMMYLLAASDDKNEIVKTSNFCFLLAKIVQIILLKDELAGLDSRMLWALPIITLLSIGGLLLGVRIRDRISVQLFKKIVLVMLFVLSMRALWSAIVLM